MFGYNVSILFITLTVNKKLMISYQLVSIFLLSLFLYIYTLYGRNVTNVIKNPPHDFVSHTEMIQKKIEHGLKTDLDSHEKLEKYLKTILDECEYIHQICIISSRYKSCMIKRTHNSYSYTVYHDFDVYADTSKTKYRRMFYEWFATDLISPRWTQPFYTSEGSDRAYVLHYTSNGIDYENGQADPIINITCKSKLRRRSDWTIIQ